MLIVNNSTPTKKYIVQNVTESNGMYDCVLKSADTLIQMRFNKTALPPFFDPKPGQIITLDNNGTVLYLRPAPGTYVAKCNGFQKREGVPLVNRRDAREAHGKNGTFTIPAHDEAYLNFRIVQVEGQAFKDYEVNLSLPLPFISYNGMLALKGFGVKKFIAIMDALGVDVSSVQIEFQANETSDVALSRLERFINTSKLYSIEVDNWGFVATLSPLPSVIERQLAQKLLYGDEPQQVQQQPSSQPQPFAVDEAFINQFPEPVKQAIQRALQGSEQDIAALKAMALLDPRLSVFVK